MITMENAFPRAGASAPSERQQEGTCTVAQQRAGEATEPAGLYISLCSSASSQHAPEVEQIQWHNSTVC